MLPLDRTMKKHIVLSGGNFMPHKEKVSTTLKMDACKKYLAKNISIAEIAKALEVKPQDLIQE